MARWFIAGVAALFLATGMFMALRPAQASGLRIICAHYDYCVETKGKGNCAKLSDLWDQSEIAQWSDLDWDQSKYARACKKFNAFEKCVADREAGKVKHCYENDRKWRGPWYK
jgi:hypothetical protein